MITDRTQNDVVLSKEIIEKKVKNFISLTEQEIEVLEKGTLTINSLNRIEGEIQNLVSLINEIGYWNTLVYVKNWDFNGIFKKDDFARIIENIKSVRSAFFAYTSTPETPLPIYYYSNFNDIEKIIFDLGKMVEDIKSNYVYCGDYECGE